MHRLSILVLFITRSMLFAETGQDAWLRYAPVGEATAQTYRSTIPGVVSLVGESPLGTTARGELIRGVHGMLGRTLRSETGVPRDSAIVLSTLDQLRAAAPQWRLTTALPPEGFWLKSVQSGGVRYTVVAGAGDRGLLYGAFELLRKIALAEPIANLDETHAPRAPSRWIDQWDNLDGSIERGYGGRSIFWDQGHARADLSRVSEYARLLASLGIQGCSINNVNADPRVIASDFLPEVARIAAAFRPWGVRIGLAVDFGSPMKVGGLDTFDPLNPRVIAWWKQKVDEIYADVPDFGGLVLKADSEGRVGPSAYGRTHADAANILARALRPHNGTLFYRGFVYDQHMDWNNPKNDRARAAYDNFHRLDGAFDDNVLVQIKNGPIDFQVREPASPLFGGLRKTGMAIELQITQEYLGQARHTVFLVPMWKEALDFDLRVRAVSPVKQLVAGFVGVANVGLDSNWTRNHLSQANLYGFGRLAWNPDWSARQIVDEWTRLTFGGRDSRVPAVISSIQLSSWRTYENYTGPLGLQTLTDITGNHYGVAVEASERNGWGQWHKADEKGMGMDRTVATGTGYIGQYAPPAARVYESLATCPDDLLLFMHHVPYRYRLHSGKTVIQAIYDSHYDGLEAAESYAAKWRTLRGLIDEQRYRDVLAQLEYQAGQAEVWRDAVVNWFLRASGIPDEKGRAGRHPGRTEAESMKLEGYRAVDVTPWEAASGGKAVSCPVARCSASFRYDGAAGQRVVRVRYFDQNNGSSRMRVFVAGRMAGEWTLSDLVPSQKIDGSTSALRTIPGVALRPGDEIRVEGIPDGSETAAVDYVEIR